MKLPQKMPSRPTGWTSTGHFAKERDRGAVELAGCCGATVCVSTPLGQVCHCAGVESPLCP
jgi:hypothetical protein